VGDNPLSSETQPSLIIHQSPDNPQSLPNSQSSLPIQSSEIQPQLSPIHHQSNPQSLIPPSKELPPRKKVWLLTTGSFCPIHKDHIEMMITVKNYLESNQSLNCQVVGGYISPTHDSYVASKMNSRGFPNIAAEHRLEMIKLLLSEYNEDWLQASEWEMNRDRFYDFPQVYSHFDIELRKKKYPIDLCVWC